MKDNVLYIQLRNMNYMNDNVKRIIISNNAAIKSKSEWVSISPKYQTQTINFNIKFKIPVKITN